MTSSLTAPANPDTEVPAPPVAVSRLRLWLGLVALSAVGVLVATPFLLPIVQHILAGRKVPLSTGIVLALQGLQVVVFASLAAAIGVWTAPRLGLDAPLLRARLGGERVGRRLLGLVPGSVLAGTLSAAAVLLLSLALKSRLPAGVGAFPEMSPWATVTAAFYGAIVEEILCRWGLLALFAFVLDRFGVSRGTGFWVANVASALGFGLLHLPAAFQLGMRPTPYVLGYLLLGNGVVGLLCGWLFRRRGLESAMLAHGSADLWLHTVFPVLGL
jgi:membrane protease YdiL (CAAX protease family)